MEKMTMDAFKEQSYIEIIESILKMNNGYVTSKELSKVVYSHMTALYFHGLSIKAPNDKYDITVPNNYFNYKIKKT